MKILTLIETSKVVVLAKDHILNLPEYMGYLNTELNQKYRLFFISESNIDEVMLTKESFGIHCVLPRQKSRFMFYFKAFFIILRIKPSLIHVFWFPLSLIIPLLSKLSGQRYHVIGDFRTKGSSGDIKRKIKDILLKLESYFFDKRVTLDDRLAHYMFGKSADCYIPMGYDQNIFHPKQISKEFDFIYAGSISKERKVYTFINQFTELTNNKYQILIIGWGNEEEEFNRLASQNKNITFLKKTSRSELVEYYFKSKIGISYVDKQVLNIQQPTKILEYIACGNKILVNDSIGTLELTNNVAFEGVVFSKVSELHGLDIDNFPKHSGANISNYSWQNIISMNLLPFYAKILNKNNH